MNRCVLLVLVGLLAGPVWGKDKTPPPVILEQDLTQMHGKTAPAILATRWVGAPVKLAELTDKVVLLNFWEAWSAGCRRLNKRLIGLQRELGPKGLVVIGIHPAENGDLAAEMVKARKYNFPVAIDDGRKTAEAYGGARRVPALFLVVGGKLAYAEIDNRAPGNIERAIANGLAGTVGEKTYRVPAAIEPPKISSVRGAGGGDILKELGGKPAPKLEVERWANHKGLDLAGLKGKVVLLDFWGVWCGPCVRSIPKLKALYEKYKDKGLMLVGVHTTNSREQLDDFLKQTPIPYPVAVDKGGATVGAYRVRAFPTLVFLDRAGKVRQVRLGWASDTQAIVEKLLAEK